MGRFPIVLSTRTPLKGGQKEQYKEQKLGYSRHYARKEDIYQYLPEIWHLTPENLSRSLYYWRSGPLRRLAQLLSRRFLEEDWELKIGGITRPMPSSLEKAHEFLTTALSEFPFWKDDLRPKLESTLSKYVGRQAGMQLKPPVGALEEWLTDQLVIAFSADSEGPITPLDKMGEGWQSLVRIAALDVLQQYKEEVNKPVLLLFEEPETYLHPHLARKLRTVLDGLSSSGWTVICSTHSPDFVSFSSSQRVVRLRREGDAVEYGVLVAEEVPQIAKFQELLDERGNHEVLFGNKVILCEGKDDVIALRHYLDAADADIDGRSISMLDLGGVGTLPVYARMASGLGIPWCGLSDEDVRGDGQANPATEEVRKRLRELASDGDLVPIWKGSLEHSLRVPPDRKATPEWQKANLLRLSQVEVDAAFPEFAKTCREVLTWIRPEQETGLTSA